ncbi:MAG: putative lipid II flippase FtsW [Candidatus Lambdaproteobacteria bacterium]|nr:putative lipid II flippase FtsW [Candidatus Lambdaproteobacteria bacterium]
MIRPFEYLYRKLIQHQVQGYDLILLGSALLLSLLGALMVYSASAPLSDRMFNSSVVFLRNHLLHLALALAALAIAMRVPYRLWRDWVPLALLISFLLLILVLIPGIGHQAGGARRWIRLGFINFQPTEVLKLVLIANVASFLDRRQDVVHEFFRGIVPTLTVMGAFLLLVVMQPDFGSVVLIALTLLLMIFVGGAKPGHILFSLAGFALIGGYLIASRSYRVQRILAFLDPWEDRLDAGFQIVQSYLAFGRGGWFGVGLGDSRQKMLFLPDAHTDFIFPILAEELGYLGVIATMVLFAVFLWRAFRVSLGAGDEFGRYLAYGIGSLFGLQILINLAVVTGLIPTKGLPLPFISYGGSSLVMAMLMVGILLNIGRQQGAAAGPTRSARSRRP